MIRLLPLVMILSWSSAELGHSPVLDSGSPNPVFLAKRNRKEQKKERRVAFTSDELGARALATLSPEERKSSAVYLDEAELKAGSTVEIDRKQIRVLFDSFVAFVDLQPQSNWGHPCRYLLINRETGAIQSIDATHPPFLKGASKTLRLIWKGENVPDWTLAVH